MVNYYEELGLDRTLGLEGLNRELNKAESTWKSRRVKSPEKATKMLALVYDARETFSSEDKRAEYDNALDAPAEDAVSDENEERRANLKKWHDTAWEYYENKEYDLAKTAIDRAMSYYDVQDELAQVFWTAARIYSRDGDEKDESLSSQALDYINQAIILDPENATYHNSKAAVLFGRGEYQKAANSFNTALRYSKNADGTDSDDSLIYRSNLALVYCYYLGNYIEAEKQAVELVRQGDPSGRGQEVLDYLSQPHESSVEELIKYQDEPFMVQCEDLREAIVSKYAGLEQNERMGWVLCEKEHWVREEYLNDDGGWLRDETTEETRRIVFKANGHFAMFSKCDEKKRYIRAPVDQYKGNWTQTKELGYTDLELHEELDFKVYTERDHERSNSESFVEHGTIVSYATLGIDQYINLTRIHIRKGEGLRVRLQEILDNNEEPVDLMPPIKKPDSKPAPPADPESKTMTDNSNSSSGGCFIATAAYGSYDCPEVWTLRRYRDYKLAQSVWGRAFIRLYYTISPTIVKLLGESPLIKRMWRERLDKFVAQLRVRGFDSTPYQDRSW